MIGLRARLIDFTGSLAGQLALILTVGLASASILSLVVAENGRRHDLTRLHLLRVVESAADLQTRFARAPQATEQMVEEGRILGARAAPPDWRMIHPASEMTSLLRARLGGRAAGEAVEMPTGACFPNLNIASRAAGMKEWTLPHCWFVRFKDTTGAVRRLSLDLMPFPVHRSPTLDPLSIVLILLTSTGLSLAVSRWASSPLRRLSAAARAFALTLDPEPIPERGPREVRLALQTFNLMQSRVREGFRERTHILASVTHDLQTPLTRLRLRLEQVEDEVLREKLIADLAHTQKLVRDGLELARSGESEEPWAIVDIDSILSSVAEDAVEFGADVTFVQGCGAQLRIKPAALARCLVNLVDNAVRYAESAELSSRLLDGQVVIQVRDQGPGIPAERLSEAFEPFRRLVSSAGAPRGSGLGLAISRAQAATFGATVSLYNRANGGLCAEIRMSLQ